MKKPMIMKTSKVRGFSLVELMVALAIGLIASIGIVSLFSGTSRTNKVQEGLARLQENGRYATARMENDFRMASAQYCSNSVGNRLTSAPASPMWVDRAPIVFAPDLALPDSGNMRRVDSTGNRSTVPATALYSLSPRYFMQGFSCTTGTSCTPALWSTSMFPSAGLAAGQRVPNSDILTIRYLRGTGWPIDGQGNCASGGTLTLAPQPGDDPISFVPSTSQLALITDCQTPSIIPISNVAGNLLTVGLRLPSTADPVCGSISDRDVRVFDFTRNMVTVTYYLAFRADDDPTARPNIGAQRLVPTLIRRENGVEQELVRGIDRLDFRYGVRDSTGNYRFLTAAQVDNRLGGTIQCTEKESNIPPAGVTTPEPGCLWRSVQRIEAHMLVNPGSEVPSLDTVGLSYRYMDTDYTVTTSTTMPSGVRAMSMPRREFVANSVMRNRTP